MDSTNKNSLSDICRVCLERSSKLYPLEGPILNTEVYISSMIIYCTSVEVVVDEDLPKGVCVPCFRTIRIAYNFIKQFKETNKKLLEEREINKNKYKVKSENDIWQEHDYVEDTPKLMEKEHFDDLQLNEYEIQDLPEDYSDSNSFSPEEKIIITYDDDSYIGEETLMEGEIKYEDDVLCENNKKINLEIEESSKELSNENILSTRYACPICSQMFADFNRGLIRHLRSFHQDDVFKCGKCFADDELTVDLYVEHYNTAHLFQCPICDKKLKSKSSFYFHSKSHVESNSSHCPYDNCKKSFQNHLSLRKHLATHSNTAKYICSKCGKKFNTYDTFRYHTKTHDGKRNHLCTLCGRTFLQSVHLKYHMWHHTGIKQFRCGDCDKSYTSVTQLKKHRRKYCGSGQQVITKVLK